MPSKRTSALQFTKLTGAGNDFILLDNRRGIVRDAPSLARRLCDRRFGVGADGLLLVEQSRIARYRMMYYNADGSSGGMCGNGGRCIARYAVANKIAPSDHAFEALGHVYEATVRKDSVTLRMKDVVEYAAVKEVVNRGVALSVSRVNTGSPHIVLGLPQPGLPGPLAEVPVEELGRRLRHHDAFKPEGTNVNFVERDGPTRLSMRTYERGVEAETLACGTGSVACALAGNLLWGLRSPVTVTTASGKRLQIRFRVRNGAFVRISLTGPAEIVFQGSVHA
jgi:diaminopimelate epimerase